MPGATSPWRVNDAVAYDRMRDTATALWGLLLASARAGGPESSAARQELAALRDETLGVDAYDRNAVAALTTRLEDRIREFRRTP